MFDEICFFTCSLGSLAPVRRLLARMEKLLALTEGLLAKQGF